MGGEYHAPNCTPGFSTLGYIYDPTTNTWAHVTPPPGWNGGDANSIVLATGQFVVADPLSTRIFSTPTFPAVWTTLPTPGKADVNDEEGWTLLPSGKFLTVDAFIRTASEIYDPVAHTWSSAGSTVVNLSDAVSAEVGPAVLMYNGVVWATGGGLHFTPTTLENGHTANYTVATGSWAAGPDFPNPLCVSDGPASLLPNGNVLVVANPDTFGIGSHFFEYDGTSLIPVPGTNHAASNPAFVYRFLLLPNGQVMATDGSTDVEFYTPNPGVVATAVPHNITSPVSLKRGNSYQLFGTQLNGLSQGNAYGDNVQNATNYPLVRFTKQVFGTTLPTIVTYGRTHNHSTMTVAPDAEGSTIFDVPTSLVPDIYCLQVVANGIPSACVEVLVMP
jgi:hypothetical protein